MKNLIILFAAILFISSCSPTEIESLQPDDPKTDTTKNPGSTTGGKELNEGNDFGNNKYWLLYKTGKFELYNTEKKETGQFDVDNAERLLRMPGTVWQIPEGAPYVFDQQNGLRFDKRLIK